MINEKEIRVGDWFEHNANWCYRSPAEIKPFIFQWEARDWYAVGECTMDLNDLMPIELSDKLLTKCGAQYESIQGLFDVWSVNGIEIYWSEVGYYHVYGDGNRFKYLHELQNFVFGTTGEELQYQP